MKEKKPTFARRAVVTGLACGALLSIGGAAVQAQEVRLVPEMRPAESMRASRFHYLDLDGDGCLSRSEVPADDPVLRSQFNSLDADKDGCVALEEYVGVAPE